MKVAFSTMGTTLDDAIEPSFSLCSNILVVDTETEQTELLKNPAVEPSAELSAAQLLTSAGVGRLLTGKCGPNAKRRLVEVGIEVQTGVAGTVRKALKRLSRGDSTAATEDDTEPAAAVEEKLTPVQVLEQLEHVERDLMQQLHDVRVRIQKLKGR